MVRILERYNKEEYYNDMNDGELDWYDTAEVINGNYCTIYTIGGIYNGMPIECIYNHATSDSVFIVVGSDRLGHFEVSIDGYLMNGSYIDEELPFN